MVELAGQTPGLTDLSLKGSQRTQHGPKRFCKIKDHNQDSDDKYAFVNYLVQEIRRNVRKLLLYTLK